MKSDAATVSLNSTDAVCASAPVASGSVVEMVLGSELGATSGFSGKSGAILDQPATASLQSSCPAAPANSLAVKDAVLAPAIAAPLIDVSGPVLRMEPTVVFVNHDSDALIEPAAAAFAAVDTQIVPADVLLTDPAVICVSDTAPAFVGVDLLATKVLRCEPAMAKSVAVNAAVTAPFDNTLTKVADVPMYSSESPSVGILMGATGLNEGSVMQSKVFKKGK